MKRKIIIYSPILYSFISFVINLIIWVLIILFWVLNSLNKISIWLSLFIGIIHICAFWLLFLFSKIQTFYSFWRFLYTNTSTATSQLFIHFHQDQKVKEFEKAFKLIKIFGTFTSWFWVFGLIYKKNVEVKRTFDAFKKFLIFNPKIYRLVDLRQFSYQIPPIEIDYILVEI